VHPQLDGYTLHIYHFLDYAHLASQ